MTEQNKNEKDEDPRVWVVIRKPGDPKCILLGRRAPRCNNPGTYGLFGGHVDLGESLLEAAVRELEEETTMVASESQLRLVKISTRKGAPNSWFELSVGGTPHFDLSCVHFTSEVDSYLWYNTQTGYVNKVLNYLTNLVEDIKLHYSMKCFLKED